MKKAIILGENQIKWLTDLLKSLNKLSESNFFGPVDKSKHQILKDLISKLNVVEDN